MKFIKVACVLLCAINLFNLAEFKVTNYNTKNSIPSHHHTNIGYKERKSLAEDFTVYVGFANNPFGPSTRFVSKGNMMENISFPIPKYQTTGPDSTENVVDIGRIAETEARSKRGVFQLYNMVKCATGCNPIIFKGYGCYCGFLGSGKAVDGVDKCCKRHDWCYNNVGCPPFFEYFIPYLWKCHRNRPLCAIDNGEWGGPKSCARRLCECDRILSECLSRFPCPSSRALCHSSPWRLLQNAFMLF